MRSKGYRRGTRHRFSQDFRKHGPVNTSTYLKTYKINDLVDIKVNPSIHKGMPHKFYHGNTGKVFSVNLRSVGVIIYKKVGNRMVEKRINVRIEHVRKSRCNEDFIKRRTENDKLRREAAEKGEKVGNLKRVVCGPRPAFTLSLENNTPVKVGYEPYYEVY